MTRFRILRRQAKPGDREQVATYVFSFPFWLYVDTDKAPSAELVEFEGGQLRFYSPFRSAPANQTILPAPDLTQLRQSDGSLVAPFTPTVGSLAAVPNMKTANAPGGGITLVWSPQWKDPPRVFPMDSLQVDLVKAPLGGLPLQQILSEFLSLLRFHTRQWWMGHAMSPGIHGYLRCLVPRQADGSLSVEELQPHAAARKLRGVEKPIDVTLWQRTLQDLLGRCEAPFTSLLLLDAYYHLAGGDMRRFVMDASGAAEAAKESAFERLWSSHGRGSRYRRGKVLSGYDLPEHLDKALRKHVGRSYREEHPSHFAALQDLWSLRGDITHGKAPILRRSSGVIRIDDTMARPLFESAEHVVDWLNCL